MPNYRRWYVAGGQYFFTVVTWGRTPIFREPRARDLLGASFRKVRTAYPFQVPAIVLLPDHLHCIWTLPRGDDRFSIRWRLIKRNFSKVWARGRPQCLPTRGEASRWKREEFCIWQRRFWEHVIRDEDDFAATVDYIHYNPVKHGYVAHPGDWPASSFGRFARAGLYDETWGLVEPRIPIQPDRGFE